MQNAKMEVHILEDGWMSLIRKKKKKILYGNSQGSGYSGALKLVYF